MTFLEKETAALASRGWAQMFGLDIRAAALTVIVDLMASSATIASMGLFIPLEMAAGIALFFIVSRIQRSWYGDTRESAMIKGLIVGLLTAIPVATTPYIIAYAIGGTVLGLRGKAAARDVTDAREK